MKRPMESASGSTGGGNKKLHLPKPKPKTLVTVEKTERKVETSSSTTSVMEYDTVTQSDAVEKALEVIRNKIPATPSSTTPGGTAIPVTPPELLEVKMREGESSTASSTARTDLGGTWDEMVKATEMALEMARK